MIERKVAKDGKDMIGKKVRVRLEACRLLASMSRVDEVQRLRDTFGRQAAVRPCTGLAVLESCRFAKKCGCGTPDTDADNDGVPSCRDMCDNDWFKTEPGQCGCGESEMDSDSDGVPDCNDKCPHDPDKSEEGTCGVARRGTFSNFI